MSGRAFITGVTVARESILVDRRVQKGKFEAKILDKLLGAKFTSPAAKIVTNMKSIPTSQVLLVSALLLFSANGQEPLQFHYSTSVTGSLNLAVRDGPSVASYNISFGQMEADVFLDPTAGTVRQVGSVQITPAVGTLDLSQTKTVPGVFPNPPSSIYGELKVTLGISGGALNFDTGPRPVWWNPILELYEIDSREGIFLDDIPIAGNYELVTGDKTYSGSFTYDLIRLFGGAYVYRKVKTDNYPHSLTLSDMGQEGGLAYPGALFNYQANTATLAEFTADNGYKVTLTPELSFFNWQGAPVVALAVPVPEPKSLAYIAMAALIFGSFAVMRRPK